jgi:hypothetical protein
MKTVIQVRVFRGDKLYVAEGLDLRVVTEAESPDKLAADLKEAITLQVDGENLPDFGLVDESAVLVASELGILADAQARGDK